MQRSSSTIGNLAAALAKAQGELVNPVKSEVASIAEGNAERLFRYASLAAGLHIVRKTLGQHEIATLQTTAIDAAAALVSLTTVLAHSSGEWVASDWPVCPVAEVANPQRMGAALTYARRYGLFTLVGIAGEDDLDAPQPVGSPAKVFGNGNRAAEKPLNGQSRTSAKREKLHHHGDILGPLQSAELRDAILKEIDALGSCDDAATWAHRTIRQKNRLTSADANGVEEAFQSKLSALSAYPSWPEPDPANAASKLPEQTPERVSPHRIRRPKAIDKTALVLPEARRIRDREHLRFVARQACLICGRRPSDAHHLRFAQAKALSRKASDEFTVPLCRAHHREVHRHGDEASWWSKTTMDPISAARALWLETHPRMQHRSAEPAAMEARLPESS